MFYSVTRDGERLHIFLVPTLSGNSWASFTLDAVEAENAVLWRGDCKLVASNSEETQAAFKAERLDALRDMWEREAGNCDFLRPDFVDEPWYAEFSDIHFPTLSFDDGRTMVAFFENEKKLLENRRTKMRLGRYLRRFNAFLKDEEVERRVAETDVRLRGPGVTITQDADEIEQVYVNGPRSCMAHPASSFSSEGIHPSRVYAGPDLGVAYIGEPEDPSARAIVWPEKKIYGGVYGDVSRITNGLKAMGFRAYDSGEFDGARCRYLETPSGSVVMPYVDVASGATERGGFIILGEGYCYETCNTHGLGSDDYRAICESCDHAYDSENEGGSLATGRYHYISVCDDCYTSEGVYCHESDERVRDDRVTRVITSSGDTAYVADWRLDDYMRVEDRDELVHIDQCVEVNDEWYHVDDAPDAEDEDEDDDAEARSVPALPTMAELEAAGQARLPLPEPTPVEVEAPLSGEAYTVFVWNGERAPGAWAPCTLTGSTDGLNQPHDYAACAEFVREMERTHVRPDLAYRIVNVGAPQFNVIDEDSGHLLTQSGPRDLAGAREFIRICLSWTPTRRLAVRLDRPEPTTRLASLALAA